MKNPKQLLDERLLSPAQVAEFLSISRWTVYSWLSDGRIRSVKIGRLVRIPESEVERIVRGEVAEADSQ